MEFLKIAIAGNKGGVGKTLVALNLFHAINDLSERACTLVDAHIQVPNLYHYFKKLPKAEEVIVSVRIPEIDMEACTFCGRCVHYCAFDAILMIKESNYIKVLDDYCTSCGACVYACNDNAISERIEQLGKISIYDLSEGGRFIEGRMFAIRPLASPIIIQLNEIIENHPISIVDTRPVNSYPFSESVRDADFTVLVTESGKSGLANLKDQIKILRDMNQQFAVFINKSGMNDSLLKDFLKEENIPVLMELAFKRDYAVLHSKAEILVKYDAELKQEFQIMFQKIVELTKEVGL
jgi:MinD superfamily P-loop ATPase